MTDETLDWQYLRDNPSAFIEKIVGVTPFDYQADFMDNPQDRKCFVAGRQVGKSRVASWMALHYAVTHPDSLVLVTADALRQSSELFAQLQTEINNAGMSDNAWGIVRSTQTEVEFEHGSRIKVVPTGRNGNKIRGFTADLIIIDEAAFVEDSIFEEVIEPMTFVSKGTIVMCSTPYGASGYFYRKAKGIDSDAEDWHTTQVESSDNPKITEEDIERFKAGKTRTQIRQEVLGEFVPTGDQFFPNPLIKRCQSDTVERTTDEVYAGVDLAAGGDDETVIAMCDGNGNIFSVESSDLGIIESRKRVEQLDMHYNYEKIVVDRTGLGEGPAAELQKELGERRVEVEYLSTQKKQSVYQTFKSHLESGDIVFPYRKDIRNQMESIGFDKTKTGNLSIHAKGGFHDDIPDAMALCVWGLPDYAGREGDGARGMTKMLTIGGVERGSDGKRRYRFNGNDDESGDEHMTRAYVGSNSLEYD